jgi:hypothetical protein
MEPAPYPLQWSGVKGKLAKVELLSTREALKTKQHEHSELRTAVGLVCNALKVIQACPGGARYGVILGSHLSRLGLK